MSVDEPDDEIIRKKEFKRSFELNIEGRQSVLLLVRREGQPRFIVLKFN